MSEPAISVLLSTYDGAEFVAASVDSVLRQDLGDFELLIVDDASHDDTPKILASFRDPRIRLTRRTDNRGLFANLNGLIDESRGDLIKLWSQDDVMHSDCLARGLRFFHDHPDIGCFYSNCNYLNDDGSLVPPPADATPDILPPAQADLYAFLHGCLSANISNLFIPRAVLTQVGAFDSARIAADFEMMVRIQEKLAVGRIARPLTDIRRHAEQWSQALPSMVKFVRDDVDLYRILLHRVVHVHHHFGEAEARRILRRRFARQHFHGFVHLLLRLRFQDAARSLLAQSRLFSVPSLFWSWLGSLGGRLTDRLRNT